MKFSVLTTCRAYVKIDPFDVFPWYQKNSGFIVEIPFYNCSTKISGKRLNSHSPKDDKSDVSKSLNYTCNNDSVRMPQIQLIYIICKYINPCIVIVTLNVWGSYKNKP